MADTGDRQAIVTGCSSGIGHAIATGLLEDGWRVCGVSRRAPEIGSSRFSHIAADLVDPAAPGRVSDAAGPAFALVHAAGLLRTGSIDEMNFDDGEAMWRLHVDAAARLVQAVVPRMPDGGRILLLGSRVSHGAPGKALYAASKAAIGGLARSFAAELVGRRITVNVIAPGATHTPMLNDPVRQSVPPRLPPMGRFVQPEEISAVTAFLLSDMAGSITGQEITVCGGASL